MPSGGRRKSEDVLSSWFGAPKWEILVRKARKDQRVSLPINCSGESYETRESNNRRPLRGARHCVERLLDPVPRDPAGGQTFENLGHPSSTCSFKLLSQVRSPENTHVPRWWRALTTLGRQSVPLTGSAHQVRAFPGWVGRIGVRLPRAPPGCVTCLRLIRTRASRTSLLPLFLVAALQSRARGDLTSSLEARVPRHCGPAR